MNKENTCCNKCKDYDPCYKISCPCHIVTVPSDVNDPNMSRTFVNSYVKENMPESWEAEFDKKFDGVLETTFQVESKEYPIPSVTRFVENDIKTFIRSVLAQERAKAVSEVCDYIEQNINYSMSPSQLISLFKEARSRGELNEKEV